MEIKKISRFSFIGILFIIVILVLLKTVKSDSSFKAINKELIQTKTELKKASESNQKAKKEIIKLENSLIGFKRENEVLKNQRDSISIEFKIKNAVNKEEIKKLKEEQKAIKIKLTNLREQNCQFE